MIFLLETSISVGEGLFQIDFEDSGGGCGCFSDGQED